MVTWLAGPKRAVASGRVTRPPSITPSRCCSPPRGPPRFRTPGRASAAGRTRAGRRWISRRRRSGSSRSRERRARHRRGSTPAACRPWPRPATSHRWLETAGFKQIEITVVAREEQPPNFQTILAAGEK
jgi:hypothetical protein